MTEKGEGVSEYVSEKIMELKDLYKKTYDTKISDYNNPTREEKFNLAMLVKDKWDAVEIMAGRRIDASEPLANLYFLLWNVNNKNGTIEDFLRGIPNLYTPQE